MEGRLGQPHGPHQPQMYGQHHHLQTKSHHGTGGRPYPILKAATAVTAGGSLLVLSGLILAGTIIGLTIATPLIVIFSPVLAPAAIVITFLTAGFLASGGLGVAALSVSSWIYSYVTGKHPVMADTLDRAGMKMTTTAKEIKGKAEQIGHQTQ